MFDKRSVSRMTTHFKLRGVEEYLKYKEFLKENDGNLKKLECGCTEQANLDTQIKIKDGLKSLRYNFFTVGYRCDIHHLIVKEGDRRHDITVYEERERSELI